MGYCLQGLLPRAWRSRRGPQTSLQLQGQSLSSHERITSADTQLSAGSLQSIFKFQID